MELGSPLGGRLSGPGFLSHLIIHASPLCTAPLQHLGKRQSAPLSQPLAATLIAYWLSLLTTAGHRNNSHWPRCQESREGRIKKKKKRRESKERELDKRQTARGDVRI